MVRRKATRVLPRNKPQKPDITFTEDCFDNETKKEKLQKRLEDFDRQVEEIVKKMEEDKESLIEYIKDLYFIDEQRTPADVNNMLWKTFLEQNGHMQYQRLEIRESIAELVNKVEQPTVNGKKKKGTVLVEDTPIGRTTRSMRTRKIDNTFGSNTENNTLQSKKPSRSRKLKEDISTPLNQVIPKVPSLLITPKFDPRTPLPLHTLRKPKVGEIAVSLKGSPLLVATKAESRVNNLDSELTSKTKEELQLLKERVVQLLDM